MYCKKCGGKLESYASNCAFCGAPVEKYDTNMEYVKQENKKAKPKHMTAFKWIGLDLLNIIPVIGQIVYLVLMFKWGFGANKDLTLKGFARSRLLIFLLFGLLLIALGIFVVVNPEILDKAKELLKK